MTLFSTDDFIGWRGLALVSALTATASYYASSRRYELARIPTVGGTDLPLLSWYSSYKFLMDGPAIIRKGYAKYKGGAFKVGLGHKWVVLVSSPALIDELRRQPAEVMSQRAATNIIASLEESLGPEVAWDTYINELALSLLTKNPEALFAELQDEMDHTFNEHIELKDEDWVPVPAMKTLTNILTGVVLRAFVGVPLSRNEEWIDLNTKFPGTLTTSTVIIDAFPSSLRSFAKSWLTPLPRTIRKATQLLEPLVQERLARLEDPDSLEPREADDVLNRMITHFRADGDGNIAERIVLRILLLDIVATNTTLITLTHVLYTVAADPSYLPELRSEAEAVIAEHGRTKAAMGKLHKMDAYIKEIMRFEASGVTLTRVAQVPYTFSDGTSVPAGTMVGAAALPAHRDETRYTDADTFKPDRFVEEFHGDEGARVRHSMSTTSNNYLVFGHGRYACPGRFFASNVLKLALTHIILNYDIKPEKDGVRPKNWVLLSEQIPNSKAKILFRKRQT